MRFPTSSNQRVRAASILAMSGLLAGVPTLHADIVAGPDIIPAPASVEPEPAGHVNDHQQAFNERQGVALPEDVQIDPGGALIAAGTLVDSHMILLNPAGSADDLDRTWTFDGQIIGVLSDQNGTFEAASSSFLGAEGTVYPGAFNYRGLETIDSYDVNGNSITVSMRVNGGGDWMRVLTAPPDAAQWISPNGSPPGTPPTVTFLQQESNPGLSVFDIQVNGIWAEPVTRDGAQYHKLRMPGHRSMTAQSGRPALPRIALNLALPEGADMSIQNVDITQSQAMPGVRVWPAQPDYEEFEEGQYDEPPFTIDQQFYQNSQALYPALSARPSGEPGLLRRVRVQGAVVHPVRVVAADDALILDYAIRVEIAHQGQGGDAISMTRRTHRMFHSLLDNALIAELNWDFGAISYDGCYLIVTPPAYTDELDPFEQLKREQGFKVTTLTTDDIGSTSAAIRSAINDWYDDCAHQGDAYVLLVGDVDQVPFIDGIVFGDPGDHYYSCLEGGILDIHPDVGLGRLSVDDEQDCAEQVEKLIRYQENPPAVPGFYDDVLLLAHWETDQNGDLKYVPVMEDISDWYNAYTDDNVIERFGTRSDGTVDNALADLSDGVNLTCYRGHGSSREWWTWDFFGLSLWDYQVEDLTNGHKTGMVLSVACTNNGLDLQDDCFGEEFMNGSQNGAVAHYGASRATYTSVNHDLAYWFMLLIQDDSHPTIADALYTTWVTVLYEHDSSSNSQENWWDYLLLGDPSMRLWRDNPHPFVLIGPQNIDLDVPGIPFQVTDADGNPAGNAIVSIVQGETLIANRYTGPDGWVIVPIDGAQEGELIVRATSDGGDFVDARMTIQVGPNCPFDLDGDGAVSTSDLLILLGQWGPCGGCASDVDNDGFVGVSDLLGLLAAWGDCP